MLSLNHDEMVQTATLLAELRREYGSAESLEFLLDAPVHASRLSRRVQKHLNRFRREEGSYTVISGHTIDEALLGPTPGHWNELPQPSPTLDHDLLLVLYASLLGDAFGWATQQDGHMIHDVVPIKANEGRQLGSAADVMLDWHTEDAFHPHRPDWVILACLRNPTATPTTLVRSEDLRLAATDLRVLFEPRFCIRPDNSHQPQHNSPDSDVDFATVEQLLAAPPAIPLLWGDPNRPYMRVDRSFWGVADPVDTEARATLERLTEEIERQLHDIVLHPGDFCILDNYTVAHGRRPFPARYDGTDRWLKRVCVTRDLRKSRSDRATLLSQILR